MNHVKQALNIVNIYGKNENRVGKIKVLESWLRLKGDLDEIKGRDKMILIMGDMNRTIRSGQYGVKGNKEKISTRGELIREQLIKTGEYVLTNNLPLAVGGPFPWVHPG